MQLVGNNVQPQAPEEMSGDARKNAVASRGKVHEAKGHAFKATLLTQPSFCSQCDAFIWGWGKQGYQCQGCSLVTHKRCHNVVRAECPKTDTQQVDNDGAGSSVQKGKHPHSFAATMFMKPTFCNHCGTLIYGLYKQGLQCKGCKTNIHKRCQPNVAHDCGHKKSASTESLPGL
ncbi:unnamed protein product [Bemisia tabaci]|uniref:Phorbol-ester/DAG-type domain-containing protein n=1 Tax=Bemisia tabaci TaxID=7038 RepID=A0A9P0AB66_BEMTA|nr:unnamed protein product [Bemisia tabaci]